MDNDTIYRQAAIDVLNAEGITKNMRAHRRILSLPSAERRGRWVTYKRHVQGSPYIAFGEDGKPFIQHHQIEVTRYKCSLCGVVEDVNTPFCSECGAKMEGEAE